jgi:hypothetical protein
MKKLRENPELAAIADRLPDIPELLEENEQSWETWEIIMGQVRIDRQGAFAFDLGAVIPVLEKRHGDDWEFELTKMHELFREKYLKGRK